MLWQVENCKLDFMQKNKSQIRNCLQLSCHYCQRRNFQPINTTSVMRRCWRVPLVSPVVASVWRWSFKSGSFQRDFLLVLTPRTSPHLHLTFFSSSGFCSVSLLSWLTMLATGVAPHSCRVVVMVTGWSGASEWWKYWAFLTTTKKIFARHKCHRNRWNVESPTFKWFFFK